MNFDAIFEKTKGIDITEKDTKKIKVKNPGILGIPSGKHFYSVPLKHYIDLAKSKGKGPVMKALNNLVRWNKNDDPGLSSKAKAIVDKLKDNPQWEKIGVKEGNVDELSAARAVDLRFKHQELKKKKEEEKSEEMDEAVNEDYNGWTNWETWNVDLWMTNEEPNYDHLYREANSLTLDGSDAERIVQEVYPDGTPDMDPGEMDNVNWDELAASWNEEFGNVEEAEEAEMEERIKEKVEKAMKEGTINFIGGFDQIGVVRKVEEGKWKVQTYEAFSVPISDWEEETKKLFFEGTLKDDKIISMVESVHGRKVASLYKGKNDLYPDGYVIGFNENRLVTMCEITEDELKSMMNESGNFEPPVAWLLEKLEPLAESQRISGHWIPVLYDFPVTEKKAQITTFPTEDEEGEKKYMVVGVPAGSSVSFLPLGKKLFNTEEEGEKAIVSFYSDPIWDLEPQRGAGALSKSYWVTLPDDFKVEEQ
jgi:hypothetical protein